MNPKLDVADSCFIHSCVYDDGKGFHHWQRTYSVNHEGGEKYGFAHSLRENSRGVCVTLQAVE
jgi:hypothetical protein